MRSQADQCRRNTVGVTSERCRWCSAMSEVMRHVKRSQKPGRTEGKKLVTSHQLTNTRTRNIPEGLLHGDPVGEEHERGEPSAEGTKRAEAAYKGQCAVAPMDYG